VTAASSNGENVIVILSPRVLVDVPSFVATRKGELRHWIEGSIRSQWVCFRRASIFGTVLWQTPSSIGYKCTAIVALALTSVKVKFIRLVAVVQFVCCAMFVEIKRSDLFSLLKVAILCASPNLTMESTAAGVLNVPAPRFVWVVRNNVMP
jgi:hypothetical protein